MFTSLPILLQLVIPGTTHSVVRCEVDAHGNFCQSVTPHHVASYCPTTEADMHLLLDSLLAREQRESAVVARPAATAADWGRLACTINSMLEHGGLTQGNVATEEFRDVEPEEKAMRAALEAVRRAPDDPVLLHLLTAMAFRMGPGNPDLSKYGVNWPVLAVWPGWSAYITATITVLAHAAGDHSTPETTRTCTSLALAMGEYGTAHDCILRSLAAGRDSTWNLLRLAWLAFHRDDRATGTQLFHRAIGAAHDRVALIDLGWHFKAIADQGPFSRAVSSDDQQPAAARERLAWLTLPHDSLMPWIAARATTKNGARLWATLETEEALAKHFAGLAFWDDRFRDCVDRERAPPCNHKDDHASLIARRLQFWDEHGVRVAVFPYHYAAPAGTPTDATAGFVLRQADVAQHDRRDSLWTGALGRGDTLRFHDGLVVATGGSALASWRLSVTRSPGDTASDFQDLQPSIDGGTISMSDLALGSPASRVVWQHGEERTPVTATSEFATGATVQLYYQIRCTNGGVTVHTTIAMYDLANTKQPGPALRLAMTGAVRPGVQSIERGLDLSRLKPGAYRLEVTVTDEHNAPIGARSVGLVLR